MTLQTNYLLYTLLVLFNLGLFSKPTKAFNAPVLNRYQIAPSFCADIVSDYWDQSLSFELPNNFFNQPWINTYLKKNNETEAKPFLINSSNYFDDTWKNYQH